MGHNPTLFGAVVHNPNRVRAGGKSQAEWDEFSQFVMKASEELGIEVASLDIEPVHHIITP